MPSTTYDIALTDETWDDDEADEMYNALRGGLNAAIVVNRPRRYRGNWDWKANKWFKTELTSTGEEQVVMDFD